MKDCRVKLLGGFCTCAKAMKSSCSCVYLRPGRGLSGPCSLTHFWYAWTVREVCVEGGNNERQEVHVTLWSLTSCPKKHRKLNKHLKPSGTLTVSPCRNPWNTMETYLSQSNWLTRLTIIMTLLLQFCISISLKAFTHSLCTFGSARTKLSSLSYRPLTHTVWNCCPGKHTHWYKQRQRIQVKMFVFYLDFGAPLRLLSCKWSRVDYEE